jgi:voltage-gated potassium channel
MPEEPRREEVGPYQFVVLVFSLTLLALLAIDLILPVPREIARLIRFIDTAVCFLFFGDFLQQLHRAPSKWRFLKWGWIDLLASVPHVDALRWGRVFRVIRILRLLRGIHSFRGLVSLLLASKARAGIASIFTLGFILVSFSSIGILFSELGADGNIKTAEQSLWWSMVTVTTVGYGDLYPVTTAGRVVAAFTMIAGVGMFGAMSGVVASFLLGSSNKSEDDVLAEVRALRSEVARLQSRTIKSGPSDDLGPS